MHSGKGGRGLVVRRLLSARCARGRQVFFSPHGPRTVASRGRICCTGVTRSRKKKSGSQGMSLGLLSGERVRTRFTRPITVAVLTLASAVAIAQSPPPRPDAGAILEQQREPLRLPPPPPDEIRPRPPEPKPALPVSPT